MISETTKPEGPSRDRSRSQPLANDRRQCQRTPGHHYRRARRCETSGVTRPDNALQDVANGPLRSVQRIGGVGQ